MNKKAIAAAGGAAALAAGFIAAPATAAPSALPKPVVHLKEKILGPETPLHLTVAGCGPKSFNEPSASAPFVHAAQKWTYDAKTKTWSTVARGEFWGILKDHKATHTTILVGCAGAQNVEVPIYWDPNYKVGKHPQPTPSPTQSKGPAPVKPKSFKVTVSPQYFHAGDTLHVAVYKCPSKPSVHSQILTGGAAWKHSKGVWKTPVMVAKGLREGYYNFTVTCKGFSPVVFKVKYGNPKDTSQRPAKHTPGHQTTEVPGGAPETGGGSTARAFV